MGEEIESGLLKTGGTVFAPREVVIDLDENVRVPMSAVNALRRRCLESLEAVRQKPKRIDVLPWEPGLHRGGFDGAPKLIFSFLKVDQMTPRILELGPDFVYLPLAEIDKNLDLVRALTKKGLPIAAVLDRITFDGQWPAVIEQLRRAVQAGASGVLCGNLGQAALLSGLGVPLRGDFGLNVTNSQSIKELRALGLSSCTVSFEMNLAQVRALSHSMPTELIAYGRLPLMVTENCVIARRTGECTCDGAATSIVDKTGRSFPLLAEGGHRNVLYNADKLYLADKQSDLQSLGVSNLRLCFTTENARECEEIALSYAGKGGKPPERMTRGLYYRGVT